MPWPQFMLDQPRRQVPPLDSSAARPGLPKDIIVMKRRARGLMANVRVSRPKLARPAMLA